LFISNCSKLRVFLYFRTVLFSGELTLFYLNGKRFRSVGVAFLFQDKLSIDLKESQSTFHFQDVETFKVEHFHGVSLSLCLRDRTKFRLFANDDCDSSKLEKLCADFEKAIQEFKCQTGLDLTREKSILESKWYFILLIAMTGIGVIGFIYGIMFGTGENRISSFFVVFVPLLTMWGGYLTTRLKRKLA
ncbi:hypothetical protein, partial [uncultured Pontibacter sp.]|uniref:hypothetical protein n=1 Tax=uncultured Pontibacter sp. TaxID=453356 RepID=UPI00261ADC64